VGLKPVVQTPEHRPRTVTWLTCAAASIVVSSSVAGQALVISGDVVSPDGRTAAPAVLVEAYDALRMLQGRTLTDSAGRFTIAVARDGAYTIVASRVGYRASIAQHRLTQTGQPRVRIVLTGETVRLSAARITTDDVCGLDQGGGTLAALAWEEVRKAIAFASVVGVASADTTDAITWRSFRRHDGAGPVWQEISGRRFPMSSGPAHGTRPGGDGSRAPGGALNYFGPDAERLISDQFPVTHCFRLARPMSPYPEEVGVAFRPMRPGTNVMEISGTAWIDTSTAVLRRLDYSYPSGPLEFGAVGAGGWIEFDRAASGTWAVLSWANMVPAPEIARDPRPRPAAKRASGAIPVIASGGSIASVDSARTRRSASRAGVVHVVVGGEASTGATVELMEAGMLARVGADRLAVLDGLAEGRHTMLVSTDAIRGLALSAIKLTATVRPNATSQAAVELPSERALLISRCGSDAEVLGAAVVFGRAARETPIDVTVATRISALEPSTFHTTSDDRGRWYVCNVPRGSVVRVTVGGVESSPASGVPLAASDRIVNLGWQRP